MRTYLLSVYILAIFTNLSALGQRESDKLYRKAHLRENIQGFLQKSDLKSALRLCEEALKDYPDNAEVYLYRGNIYSKMRQPELARKDFDQSIRIYNEWVLDSPGDPYLRYYRGNVYRAMGKYYDAIQNYNSAIRLTPLNKLFYEQRAGVFFDDGQYQKAIEDYTTLIGIDSTNYLWYIGRGKAFQERNKSEDSDDLIMAERDFNRAVRWGLRSFMPYFYRAGVCMYLGKKQEALDDLNTSISINPFYAPAYINRGLLFADNRNFKRAAQDYEEAIQLDSSNAYAWFLRGTIHTLTERDMDRALADFAMSISLNPTDTAYLTRSIIYSRRRNFDLAIQDCDSAILLNPLNWKAYQNRGYDYAEKFNYSQAIGDFSYALLWNPRDSLSIFYRAVAYQGSGEYEKAIKEYKSCFTFRTRQTEARLATVTCLIRLHRFKEAASFFGQIDKDEIEYVLSDEFRYYNVYYSAVASYLVNNQYEEALRELSNAEEKYYPGHDMDSVDIFMGLIDVYALKGYIYELLHKTDEARLYYDKAIKLNPSQADVHDRLVVLGYPAPSLLAQSSSPRDIPMIHPIPTHYHAILIAEEDYSDPHRNKLKNPIRDARILMNILKTEYTFNAVDIDTLFNQDRKQILDMINLRCATLKDSDNLLVFFAGHGELVETQNGHEDGYFIPCMAQQNEFSDYISYEDLFSAFRRSTARHILLIADACFSGILFKGDTLTRQPAWVTRAFERPSRKAMASGGKEMVPDKSVFMKYMLEGLRSNREKYLVAYDLFYRYKKTIMDNGETTPQYGVLRNAGDEGGDFVFTRK